MRFKSSGAGTPILLLAALALFNLALLPLAPAYAEEGAKEEGGHDHESGHSHEAGHAEEGHGGHEEAEGHGHDEKGHGHEGEGHGHDEAPAFDATALTNFGVVIKSAGPGRVRRSIALTGKLVPHEDRVAHVTPRFPGIIREVRKRIGDPVAKGEVVAVVESNQTLQAYEVKSLLAGTVVRRHATAGEFVDDATEIFEVADYSVLFVDFYAFPADVGSIHTGQKLIVRFPGLPNPAETSISFLSPSTDPETQARFVRGVLPNPDGAFQVGMFVTGEVVVEDVTVPVAVDATAVRSKGGLSIVFVEHENRFEPRTVLAGRRDRDAVEVLGGLSAGERYASGNTFIVQAELEKGEAEHEH